MKTAFWLCALVVAAGACSPEVTSRNCEVNSEMCAESTPTPTPTDLAVLDPPPTSEVDGRDCMDDGDCLDPNPCVVYGCGVREFGTLGRCVFRQGMTGNVLVEGAVCQGNTLGYYLCANSQPVFEAEHECDDGDLCTNDVCVNKVGCEVRAYPTPPSECLPEVSPTPSPTASQPTPSPSPTPCMPGRVEEPSRCTRNPDCVHEEYGQGVCQARSGRRFCVYTRGCPPQG